MDRIAANPLAEFAPLHTERLTLRPLTLADADALHRLVNDWEIARNLARVPFPYPRPLANDWIASTHKDLTEGTGLHLAITGDEGGVEHLVGVVGLQIDRKTRSAELGYWVGRRYWGHGVAVEAAGKLARWALANLEDIDYLSARVALDNPASMAVLRRIGFRDTGRQAEHESLALGKSRTVQLFQARRTDVARVSLPVTEPQPQSENSKPLLLVAACALIDIDGRVLLARRPEGKAMAGLWEFPGGKVQTGETPETTLIRELKEELGIDVSAVCLAPFAFASHAYDDFHLLMPLYLCRRWQGAVGPHEGQTLAWVRPNRISDYKMPEADKPLVPLLRDFLG